MANQPVDPEDFDLLESLSEIFGAPRQVADGIIAFGGNPNPTPEDPANQSEVSEAVNPEGQGK